MKTLLTATLALVFCACSSRPVVRSTEGRERWTTPASAFTDASSARKKIILDVYTDWCGWCKRMDRDTYADSAIASYMEEHYLAAKMNPEREGSLTYSGQQVSHADFARGLGVRGYPATAFFNEKGELLTMIPGYMKPKEFMLVLRFFAEDIYLTKKWEEYAAAEQARETGTQ